jgi:hypothetical protein
VYFGATNDATTTTYCNDNVSITNMIDTTEMQVIHGSMAAAALPEPPPKPRPWIRRCPRIPRFQHHRRLHRRQKPQRAGPTAAAHRANDRRHGPFGIVV